MLFCVEIFVAELVGTPKPRFVEIYFAEIESYRNCKKNLKMGFTPPPPIALLLTFECRMAKNG